MYREIKVGEMSIPMLANGATPIRYRMTFGKDIISEFEQGQQDSGKASSSISELAFIMAKAAEAMNDKKPMAALNQTNFVEWLEQFEPLDLTLASEDIIDLYMGNEKTLSEAKKNSRDAVSDK